MESTKKKEKVKDDSIESIYDPKDFQSQLTKQEQKKETFKLIRDTIMRKKGHNVDAESFKQRV